MEGITVKMPFERLNSKYNEVEIKSKDFIYSEICEGYGLQVKDESKREEIKNLCFEISNRVKKLHNLTNTKNK